MSFRASKLSLQEFLHYPDIQPPREYIAGRIYQKPPLKGKQERVLNRLLATINQTGKRQKTAYAFSDLRCTFESYSLVPDIAVFNWNNLPVDANGNLIRNRELIPNWIVEILSPEDSSIRAVNNILICLERGTQLGWLVDVQQQQVIAFPEGEQPQIQENNDCLPVLEGLGTLKLSVRDLFNRG